MKNYNIALAAGSEFIVTVVFFIFLGRWIDRTAGTGSVCILVGTVLGFVVAVWRLTTTLKKMMDKPQDPRD